jgi:hypothetical protein
MVEAHSERKMCYLETKKYFYFIFGIYQHHAHLLWDGTGGRGGGGCFLKCPHKPFLSDILFTDIFLFYENSKISQYGRVRDRKTGRFKFD